VTTNRKTKTTTTSTAVAYEAARRDREAAEQAHAAAVASLTDAERHHADLVQRNRNGDTTVTGIERASAKADIEVCADLVTAAVVAVEAARTAEAPLLAAHFAEVLADRLDGAGTEDEEAAVEAIAGALRQLTEQVEQRHQLMRGGIREAAAAGIPMGKTTGLPFGWEQRYMERQAHAIYVHGETIPITSPSNVVLDVLTRAAASVGYRLTLSHNRIIIKTD
jgi:fructose-1,6-bisphosphatase